MTASKATPQGEASDGNITLSEEYEIMEPQCVLRVPDANGEEQAITLRPGESVSSVLARHNIIRQYNSSLPTLHID